MTKIILRNLALLVDVITRLRNYLFDANFITTYSSKIPVISVGNLSLGGNGKTPLSLIIANYLANKDCRVLILTRGYKSKVKTPHLVMPEESAGLVGDEPLLLARSSRAKVLIEPNRVKGMKYIEANDLADVVILDDGFQHRYLNRDLNILAVDVSEQKLQEDFAKGELFPLGRFREALNPALKRVNVLIAVNRSVQAIDFDLDAFKSKLNYQGPAFFAQLKADKVRNVITNKSLSPQKVVAFCGLASPEAFFSSLEHLGFALEARLAYSDHYPFSSRDLENLYSKYGSMPLVCSAKDLVKIREQADPRLHVLKADLEIVNSETFFVLIQNLKIKPVH